MKLAKSATSQKVNCLTLRYLVYSQFVISFSCIHDPVLLWSQFSLFILAVVKAVICYKRFIFILLFLLLHFHNRIFIFYFILLAVYIIVTSTADIHIISLGVVASLWKILESPFINKFQNINDGKDLSELIYLYIFVNFRKRSYYYSSTNYCTQINTNLSVRQVNSCSQRRPCSP